MIKSPLPPFAKGGKFGALVSSVPHLKKGGQGGFAVFL